MSPEHLFLNTPIVMRSQPARRSRGARRLGRRSRPPDGDRFTRAATRMVNEKEWPFRGKS